MIWIIYLMDMVDDVNLVCTLVITFSIIFSIISCFGSIVSDYDETKQMFKKFIKIGVIILSTSSLLGIFIPSSKTIAAMYLVPKITANEQAQQLPDKILKVFNAKLDSWVADIDGSNKEEN